MNCQGFQVALKLPGGWSGKRGTPKRRFIDAVPHPETGDYPVSSQKLKQAVAPGVVHLVDAMFNALVVLGLERAGIADFVALHDCWTVPVVTEPEYQGIPPNQRALLDAVGDAGREWLKRLGPVYVGLVDYLGGTPFEPWVRRLQAGWEQRVREEGWPDFRVELAVGLDLGQTGAAARRANVSQGERASGDARLVDYLGGIPVDVSSTKSKT